MAGSLDPEDAAGHIGENATVCGVVASAEYEADAQSQAILLDLGSPLRMLPYCCRLWREPCKIRTPETSVRGKRICATGPISDNRGKPEIVLTDPSQLSQ